MPKAFFWASRNLRPNVKMTNKKTEILIETRERTVVRWLEKEVRTFCHVCRVESFFILPEHAAIEAGSGVREIFRLIESGLAHFIETADGLVLVCQASLSADINAARNPKTFLAILTHAVDNR